MSKSLEEFLKDLENLPVETQRGVLRHELVEFEEIRKNYELYLGEHQSNIGLFRGIALGLVYGIIGNLFVQHWYPLFERVILCNFDIVFWSNLPVCAFALFLILCVTVMYRRQVKKESLEISRTLSGWRGIIDKIEGMKRRLKELEKQ